MLIIPVEKKLDWRNPPLITLFLILVNCALFFGYQLKDGSRIDSLYENYLESSFAEQEKALYTAHLRENKPDDWSTIIAGTEYGDMQLTSMLLHDFEFEQSLREQPGFTGSEWEKARIDLEAQRDKLSYVQFGFNPANPSLTDSFVSTFLHGDFGHLLGNMIFLFIFGFALEAILGRAIYLSIYLLTAFTATGLYWLMEWGNNSFSIGASGAIAGLMGAYLGVYGLQRIRFFYWIGPYFNYMTAPALIIFPVWLGKEALGQAFSSTNVNYWAHIGGLLGGVLLSLPARYGIKQTEQLTDEPEEAPTNKGLIQLERLINNLEYEKAASLSERLIATYPQDVAVLERCYQAQKRVRKKTYHQLVLNILKLPKGASEDSLLASITPEYCETPTLLKNDKVCLIWIKRLTSSGHFQEAFTLSEKALKTSSNPQQLTTAIEKLASHLKGREEAQRQKLLSQLQALTEIAD